MSQPPTDIVRELHGAADRAGLVCTKTGNFRAAMIDAAHLRAAANEIERLRAERDEARLASVRFMEKMADILMDEANAEIEQLRKERDEARREVCELRTDIGFSRPLKPYLIEFAASRGWDCFKENTNG